jgi:nucleotide-binding universal stress UspA family protein
VEHVVVGIDVQEAPPAELVRAADLAQRLGAELDVVHVHRLSRGEMQAMVSTVPGRQLAKRFLRADERDEARAVSALAERTLAGAGLPWRLHFRAGDPAENLVAVADEVGALLIVIGTRGSGALAFLERLLAGSVSHRTLHRAHRPVLVVPKTEAEHHSDGGHPKEDR